MQCLLCNETIDDDSRYCDQCGEQILLCSECGRPGRGKRCTLDGKELIPAGSGISASSVTAKIPVQTPQQTGAEKVKLASQIHGITIEAKDGAIIGRTNGAFAGVFARFKFVSGTHCKIVKAAAGWHVEDMGSTNGTFYNGTKLAPNTLYPIASNTTIRIADVELLVTYDTDGGGTVRL